MNYTVELLIGGDKHVLAYYKNALQRWNEILKLELSLQIDSLAKHLTKEQSWFEEHCGGSGIGQEIMAIVGIAQFYSTGKGFSDRNRARTIYKALRRSYCSLDVKTHARRVAQDYRLLESEDVSV